jgi:CheY-like chemotaxis protein
MTNILLIHWNESEAETRADLLRGWGYTVTVKTILTGPEMRLFREQQLPDAFLIDLTRTPSRGRDIGVLVRQTKATRCVPLVFAGGEEEKVARVRDLLPDATYAEWDQMQPALEQAIAHPPEKPIVRGAMDGYAGASLGKKLGVRENGLVALFSLPDGFAALVTPLPPGAWVETEPPGPAQVVILFARSQTELADRFPAASQALAKGGRFWIAWPKKTSGIVSDLGQNEVRAFGLANGYMDYKISAFDETWSGLCFTRRK